MLSFILSFFHLDIVSLTCKAYFVLANCSYPRFLERPFCYWLKLIFILKTVFLNYLFVLLYLLYSVFNEHLRAKHFCVLLVGSNGLEPSTSRLSGARSSHLSYEPIVSRFRFLCPRGTYSAFFCRLCLYLGGDDGIRTHDPLLAGQVLSQLSYTPIGVFNCVSFRFFPISQDSPWKSNNKWYLFFVLLF